jgi:branched-chain amino acid transport system ATP-binding protein
MSGNPIVRVEGLDVFYGKSQILFGVGLELHEGRTLALLGRNGAGKSTTMKAIAGVAPSKRGVVEVAGKNVAGRPSHIIARTGIGYVPEDRQVFPEHTVEENLEIGAKKRVFEVFPLLEPLRQRMAGRLSGGEQQMLAIARTLMGNPIVLLLDEPSEGLAPIVVARIGELLKTLRKTGATTLIAEQNMHFCLGVADDAAVIDKGAIVYRDTIAGLKANEEVRRRYLAM